MSSISTVEARRTAGPSAVRPVVRPVRRDRRGPARPSPVAAHGATRCPAPVPGSRAVPAGMLRRVTAGVGLVVASAAAVVGLGLLADVSAAVVPPQPGIAAGQP